MIPCDWSPYPSISNLKLNSRACLKFRPLWCSQAATTATGILPDAFLPVVSLPRLALRFAFFSLDCSQGSNWTMQGFPLTSITRLQTVDFLIFHFSPLDSVQQPLPIPESEQEGLCVVASNCRVTARLWILFFSSPQLLPNQGGRLGVRNLLSRWLCISGLDLSSIWSALIPLCFMHLIVIAAVWG